MLGDFAQSYWEATHPLERTEMGTTAASDIVVAVLLAIVTAGVGAAAGVAAKAPRLARLARLLEKLAGILKSTGAIHQLPKKEVPGSVAATARGGISKPSLRNARRGGMPEVQTPENKPAPGAPDRPRDPVDKTKEMDYAGSDKIEGPKTTKPIADKKFKRKHLDGDPKDPYTLMPDGKPMGAEVGKVPSHMKGMDDLPANHNEYVKDGWPDLNAEYRKGQFAEDFRNFCDAKPDTLKPGTKIYRIIDDQSGEFMQGVSGSYWATEMPRNKTAWRRDYAVKDSWNDNGYFVEETVGPKGLKAWRGGTAAQRYEDSDFFLSGGNEQIFVQRGAIGNPQPKLTNWSDL
jgi:hypothetical protein